MSLALASVARAETPAFTVTDSVAWQAHYEGWVDRFLTAREVELASKAIPTPDPASVQRVLLELYDQRVRGLARDAVPPPGTSLPPAASGLTGDGLKAARLYASGDVTGALAALSSKALERDPGAAFLRAQLLDERAKSVPVWRTRELIDEYRIALSLGGEPDARTRARTRIAQLWMQLGFMPEAQASLGPYLSPLPPPPFDVPLVLTFADAAERTRSYRAALTALESLPREQVPDDVFPWLLQRKADLHFRLEEFGDAASGYAEYEAELRRREKPGPDALTQTWWAYSQIRMNRAEAAVARLETIFSVHPDDPLTPMVDLTLVRALAATGNDVRLRSVADDSRTRHIDTPEASLAATFLLESQRRTGGGLAAPRGVSIMARPDSTEPERGLLTYSIELGRDELGEPDERLQRLSQLTRTQPDGPVKALVHDALAYLLLQRLREASARSGGPSDALLDRLASELNAKQMDENGLLLTLEAFVRSGRFDSCVSWAAALREREVRPVRRGLSAWREIQCEQRRAVSGGAPAAEAPAEAAPAAPAETEPAPENVDPIERLLVLADSGDAGPYSLGIVALAAELTIQKGDLPGALRIYESGLESFAEPQLIGPVLIRLGELHAAADKRAVARQRLTRGLTLTEGNATVSDPFRKLGLVALARLSRELPEALRLKEALQKDLPRVDPWWQSAYAVLGARVGVTQTPSGDDPFARAAAELERSRSVRERLRAVTERPRPEKKKP